jgi:hypothetical protein
LIRVVEACRNRDGSARCSCEQPGGREWEKNGRGREEDEADYVDRFWQQIARINAGEIFLEAVIKLRDLRKKVDVSNDVRYGTHQSGERKRMPALRVVLARPGTHTLVRSLASLDGYSTSWPVFSFLFFFSFC